MRTVSRLVVVLVVVLVAGCRGTPRAADVVITVGDNWQAAVNANPPGTTFRIRRGVHRQQSVEPKAGDRFLGEPGTIATGAKTLTGWKASGGTWYVAGQTQEGDTTGVDASVCRAEHPRCVRPEDVFRDGVALRHVASVSAVTGGTWFFDYPGDRIYVGDDPNGHVLETSLTPYAFTNMGVQVADVEIADVIIEKYATPANRGAINAPNADHWTIARVDARLNHATGIAVGTRSSVTESRTYRNGQNGIGAYNGAGLTIANNESWRNGAYFNPFWGAGGMKVAQIAHSTIRRNRVHHNAGAGIWCDIDCADIVIDDNVAEYNEQSGIFYEISFDGTIRNNVVRRNGYGVTEGPLQAGITIAESQNVDVVGNVVELNRAGVIVYQEPRGVSPLYGVPWTVANVRVEDNVITMDAGTTGLMHAGGGTPDLIRFDRNRYRLGASAAAYFSWLSATVDSIAWRTMFGQDTGGTVSRCVLCASPADDPGGGSLPPSR